MEKIKVQFSNSLLCDRLYMLAVEYDVPVDLIISLAVKRLLDDVELIRSLRTGKVKLE